MRLKQQLENVVNRAINDENLARSLRSEVSRVLGPCVDTDVGLKALLTATNDRLTVLEMSGRGTRSFDAGVMIKLSRHDDPEARRLSARVLPTATLGKFTSDKDSVVRETVARRIALPDLRRMLTRFPDDDGIRAVYRTRLNEEGLPKPEVQDEPFDMYGEKRLGSAAKQQDLPELSDQWYESKAAKFIQDYGTNIEYNWEETLVRSLARGMRSQANVNIDEKKLLKAIADLVKKKEDEILDRNEVTIKETLAYLRSKEDLITEGVNEIENICEDPVLEMMSARHTPQQFIDEAKVLFSIKESVMPPTIRKHRLDVSVRETIPMVGYLPHKGSFRSIDERALDRFVKHWNDRQSMTGEPLKLEWSCHPDSENKVSFSVILK